MSNDKCTPSGTLADVCAEWLRINKPHLYALADEDIDDLRADANALARFIEERMGQPSDQLRAAVAGMLATIDVARHNGWHSVDVAAVYDAEIVLRRELGRCTEQEKTSPREEVRSKTAGPISCCNPTPAREGEEAGPFGERPSDAPPRSRCPTCGKDGRTAGTTTTGNPTYTCDAGHGAWSEPARYQRLVPGWRPDEASMTESERAIANAPTGDDPYREPRPANVSPEMRPDQPLAARVQGALIAIQAGTFPTPAMERAVRDLEYVRDELRRTEVKHMAEGKKTE